MRLFLGLFCFFLIALGGTTAACVAATHHFLHWDISAWTDTSAWNSRSFVVGAIIVALSTIAASLGALIWRFVMSAIASATARPKKVRPRSWRRTTT
ncbi:MAG: hypothetical protein U0931_18490 [Vulcanimicrobiota bacterium]